jgi:hypothetical protein
LTRAKDQAKAIYCLNSQSAIAKGLIQYATDWAMYPMNYRNWSLNPGYDTTYGFPPRFALDGLSKYVGGPAGAVWGTPEVMHEGDLRSNMDSTHRASFADFPKSYVCPNGDKMALYPTVVKPLGTDEMGPGNFNFWYHASYWVNPAVRSNRGFNRTDDMCGNGSKGQVPGMNYGMGRFYAYCPNYDVGGKLYAHWKAIYYPNPESIRNPEGTHFTGDTNNKQETLADGTLSAEKAGFWRLLPGWGPMIDGMGFERHGDRIMTVCIDGHGRPVTKGEVWGPKSAKYDDDNPSLDFMNTTIGDDGCGGVNADNQTGFHRIAPPAFQYGTNSASNQE